MQYFDYNLYALESAGVLALKFKIGMVSLIIVFCIAFDNSFGDSVINI